MTKAICLAPSTSPTESSFPTSAKTRRTATERHSSTRCLDLPERMSDCRGALLSFAGVFVKRAEKRPISTVHLRKPFGVGLKVGDGSSSIRKICSDGRARYLAGRIQIVRTGTSASFRSDSRNWEESFRSERSKATRAEAWSETGMALILFTARSRRWMTSHSGS